MAGTLTGTAYCTRTNPKKKKKKGKGKGKKGADALAAKKKKKKKKKKRKPPFPVSATTPFGPSDPEAEAVVSCPTGTTVRSGGFDTTGVAATPIVMQLVSPTQWRVVVQEAESGATTVTAVALCGKGPALTASPGAPIPVPPSGEIAATASCPAGQRVAFGGFTLIGPTGGGLVKRIRRVDDAVFEVAARGTEPALLLTPTAYCEPA